MGADQAALTSRTGGFWRIGQAETSRLGWGWVESGRFLDCVLERAELLPAEPVRQSTGTDRELQGESARYSAQHRSAAGGMAVHRSPAGICSSPGAAACNRG